MNRIDAIRRFNRFYTRRVGALQPQYLSSPYSLPQARVLYEIGQRSECTASELGADLDLDLGYLSRLLQGLKRSGLVQGEAAKEDARRVRLTLTARGRRAYQQLDARSRDEVGAMLGKLGASEQTRLVDALKTVEGVLEKKPDNSVSLRAHRPGDMGWVIGAHGRLYAEEYGWDERFEALVAGIAAGFIDDFDKNRERCWIAEMNGEPVGCVFVVKRSKSVAKLRCDVTTAALASVGATTLAVARLTGELAGGRGRGTPRGGPAGRGPAWAAADGVEATVSFRSERLLRVDGGPPADLWGPLSGDYRTADGWVRLHCNFDHHRRAAQGALGQADRSADDRPALAAELAGRRALDVEEAVVAAGGCAAALRTGAQWRAHPQAAVLARSPVVALRRIEATARHAGAAGGRTASEPVGGG